MPSMELLEAGYDATAVRRRFWMYLLTSCGFAAVLAVHIADWDRGSAISGSFTWAPALAVLTGALALLLWRRSHAFRDDTRETQSPETATLSDFARWRTLRASQIPTVALDEISTALSTKVDGSNAHADFQPHHAPSVERPASQDRNYWSKVLASLDVDKSKGRSRK